VQVVFALVLCKAVMWIIALSSGTSGGVLAPLLIMGAGLGVVVGPYLPGHHAALWPLVFMAATLGGMMRAPIMSVIFAFELTHDVNALLPLLAAAAVAYGFTVLMMPRSILTEKLARRGHHIYREYGVDPLERHGVEEVMTENVQTIESNVKLIEALGSYFGLEQQHRAYPVVKNGVLLGMVDREAISAHLLKLESAVVGDLFGINVPIMAIPGETCRTVATRLAVHGLERIPVVTDAKSRHLIGIISRSDLIKPSLNLFAEEHVYERFRKTPLAGLYNRFKSAQTG
jgi:CBS domain-containing protein